MRARWTALTAAALLCSSLPALAQGTRPHTFMSLVTYPPALGWLVCSGLGAYLLSVVITALFGRSGFPPTVARLGCWVGLTFWMLFIVFFISGWILHLVIPAFILVILILLIVLFGVVLMLTRRRATE